ncbi:hypothetical protein K2Y11_10380 [bacterium]|nr:hypothetical protein [bacterium]
MTTAGKVFSVLSLLIGIAFLVLVVPVARHLIEVQKQIEQIEKRHPAMRDAVAKLETKRLQLTYELNRQKDEVTSIVTRHNNQADVIKSQLSLLNDLEKAERAGVVRWQDAVRDINAEIGFRQQEKSNLEQEIAQQESMKQERTNQVAELKEALQNAKQKLEETLANTYKNYEKLERLVNAAIGQSEGRVAAGR